MKKITLFLGLALFTIAGGYAQELNFGQSAKTIWDQVRSNAPVIFAIIFLVSMLFNSGKLAGDNRDYMAFFKGVLIWVAAISVITAVVAYIASRKF